MLLRILPLWFCIGLSLNAMSATPFTYEDLVNTINQNHLETIAEVIEKLPDDLLSHYTLVYESQSLQGASYLSPRAILFGSDAKLIVAFNGESTQSHYNRLEVIQFRDATDEFEFRSIDFPKELKQTGPVTFTEKNPQQCLSCHQHDPKPNFTGYSSWHGFYGSFDDELSFPGQEKTSFEEFQNKFFNQGRYRFLKKPEGSKYSPYMDDFGKDVFKLYFRPNLLFVAEEAGLLKRRAVRILSQHPQFAKLQYLYLLIAMGCPNFNSKAEIEKVLGADATKPFGKYSFEKGDPGILATAFILHSAGLPAENLNSHFPFTESDYGFWNGVGTDYEYVKVGLYEKLMKEDGVFQSYYQTRRYFEETNYQDAALATAADDSCHTMKLNSNAEVCDLLNTRYQASLLGLFL